MEKEMPDWWPFKKQPKEDPKAAFRAAEAALRQQFEEQLADGVSRQAILHYIETQSQMLEQQPETIANKARLRALDLIYSELHPRVLGSVSTGKAYEMAGQVDKAISYYETAISDQVATRFPYEHLRVIYRRQGAYADALRVCRLALNNPFLSEKDHDHFRNWAGKLEYQLIADAAHET